MWIVITGNPISGHKFHGPFRDRDTAAMYAYEVLESSPDWPEWWMAELEYVFPDREEHPRPTLNIVHPSAGWQR